MVNFKRLLDSAPIQSHKVTWGERVADGTVMSVTIILKPSKPPDDLIMKVKEVEHSLPLLRPLISEDEFEEIHRPAEDAFDAFKDFAKEAGLSVVGTSTHGHSIKLEGPVGKLNAAFNVELVYCVHDGVTHVAHREDVSLPLDLGGRVQAVIGLDDFPEGYQMRPMLGAPARERKQARSYTPIELAERYAFPAGLDGAGQRIAIVAFGGGYHQEDLDSYFKGLGLGDGPTVTPVTVSQGGPGNAPTPMRQLGRLVDALNDEALSFEDIIEEISCGNCLRRFLGTLETTMDIQVAGAIAPGAEIIVLFPAPGKQGWLDAINAALGINQWTAVGADRHPRPPPPILADPATILSISWGQGECRSGYTFKYAVNEALKKARDKYITVCSASGDLGSFGIEEGAGYDMFANVSFPGSSPWVLSCGGTTLDDPDGEVAWNSKWKGEHMATGGGASGFFKRRSWQEACDVPRHADYFLDDNRYSEGGLCDGEAANKDSGLNPDHCRLWSNPSRICEVYKEPLSDFVGRGVPDVAGNADGASGYKLYIGGRDTILGGTSAVAPLWAGLIARINQRLAQMAKDMDLDHPAQVGFLNRLLYTCPTVREALNSVSGSNNSIGAPADVPAFSAGVGWDALTGLGVPDGNALLEALTGTEHHV